ncbi:MAG: CDP-alcohol phosphatidyltransferase family protein [Ignavibacteriae bacterium]|nr:CDP-alcohol phosphatidyltransferase family protein [Ignavibacteriota bacterium]
MSTEQKQPGSRDRIWTLSNAISAVRLVLVVPLYLVMQAPEIDRVLVAVILLAAYISDLSDGFIARHFHQESDAGLIIDPLADKVFVLGAMAAFLGAGLIPLWYVVVVILRDVCIFFAGILLKKKTGVLAQSNYMGKAAVLSIALVILLSLFRDDLAGPVLDGAVYLSLILMAGSLWSYGARAIPLLRSHSR